MKENIYTYWDNNRIRYTVGNLDTVANTVKEAWLEILHWKRYRVKQAPNKMII